METRLAEGTVRSKVLEIDPDRIRVVRPDSLSSLPSQSPVGSRMAIMLGGAPVTQDVANLFGADGYAESAGNAVSEGIKMIGRLRELRNK